jgi:hypothetical protein
MNFSKRHLVALTSLLLNVVFTSSPSSAEDIPVNTSNEDLALQNTQISLKTLNQQSITGPSGQIISWDIDKDGNADALTDGLLLLRFTFGLTGDSLTNSAIAAGSSLSSSEVEAELNATLAIADIDGNGQVDALTDGLLLLRYLFGLTGDSLINSAVGTGSVRSTTAAIGQYLVDNMPGANTGGLPNSIVINEATSSNSTFDDEDGDSPDWLELFNNSDTTVDLTGWSLTDDSLEPTKWVFPQTMLAPGAYLRIWASNKDRAGGGTYKTLVNEGDNFRYLLPSSNPSNSWNTLGFNDSGWQQGTSGFGYADGDDSTVVPNGTRSVYVRKTFTISDLEFMDKLWLDIDFDDGFVAYINGVEIARSNILGDRPNFDAGTINDREATMWQSGTPTRFPINDIQALLNNGDNLLSIQVHNVSSSSSDMTLIPFLSAFYLGPTDDGFSPPSLLGFEDPSLHTNFKISSDGEELILFNSSGNQIDYLNVTGLERDSSIGRSPVDGSIMFFETPTPGTANPDVGFTGIIQSEVIFSHEGGEFSAQNVTLSGAAEGEEIRYTLDATIPTVLSEVYSSPIVIDQNTVIRTKIFKENHIPSRTDSRTYITDNTHSLPIVTLVSEPDNFFDQQEGIYAYGPEENYENNLPFFGANFWQDWERDVHFSFYEPTGELGVALDAGVKIFGAWSRANDQRSMSIFARGRYGFPKLKYPIFPSLDYDKFESIVLRSSGNDWMKTNIKDVIATSLMEGSGLEYQASRSAVVYLNGDYWGFYNIREKVNEHFLDDKINVDKSEINILTNNGEVVEGSNTSYNELIDYVTNNSLSVQSNYDYVASQVDIDNIITYQIAQIYFDNTDWPGNNIKFWNSPETKWRWILYDTDFSFGRPWEGTGAHTNDTLSFALNPSGPGWPNPPWSTLLMRKLMENTQFKNQFINQFADEMNGRFEANNVRSHINATAGIVDSEITRHFQHWSNWDNRSPHWQNQYMLSSYSEWQSEVNKIIDFTDNRIGYLAGHFRSYFGINGMYSLSISINDTVAGSVQLNSLTIDSGTWGGEYFDFIPVTLTAIPNEGYVFVGWQGSVNSTDSTTTLTTSQNASVQALFAPIDD